MKRILACLSFCLVAWLAHAASEPQTILLWPGTAPGEDGSITGDEVDTTKPDGNKVAGGRVIRLGNVTKPSLTVYPAKGKGNGTSVLICPGGGYHILAWDLEGTEVAEWLNGQGITAFILKYRVPARKNRERYEAPLQDAQRAMSVIRSRAAEFGIDPQKVGILGFSAGAHLSALMSCRDEQRTYEAVDAADKLPVRPNFTVLVYPGSLADKQDPWKTAPELPVTEQTPPTFIVQTQDDGIPVQSSLTYFAALKQAKVPAELHVFPKGGHGYGLRPSEDAVSGWPRLVERWLVTAGFLPKPESR